MIIEYLKTVMSSINFSADPVAKLYMEQSLMNLWRLVFDIMEYTDIDQLYRKEL